MGNAKHLRYLCILGDSAFCTFPSSVCRLYHLTSIDADGCMFERFPPDFSDAISLLKIKSKSFYYNKHHHSDKLCVKLSGLENQMAVVPHWNLRHFRVEDYGGESCPGWLLPNLLPRLCSLEFVRCHRIKSITFFIPLEWSLPNPTGSENLSRLEELVIEHCDQISWQGLVVLPTSLRRVTVCRSGYFMDYFVRCFLGLTSLTYLKIEWSHSLTSIPLHVWSSNLPSLEELHISYCDCLTSIGASGASSSNSSVKGFSSLAKINIGSCNKLLSLDEFLAPDYLPAVKTICVYYCKELTSMSVDKLDGLEELEISDCHRLNSQRIMSFPPSLKKLHLWRCESIKCIDTDNGQLGSCPGLEELNILSCSVLRSIGGAAAVAKIKNVNIVECPELKEIQLPFRH